MKNHSLVTMYRNFCIFSFMLSYLAVVVNEGHGSVATVMFHYMNS